MSSYLCGVVRALLFFFSSRRRHTRCALVTGVQTCAVPILSKVATPQNEIAAAIDVSLPSALAAALTAPRIVIEKISPNVDGGRFAAKAIVDHAVSVTAAIIMDGHDQLDAQAWWYDDG